MEKPVKINTDEMKPIDIKLLSSALLESIEAYFDNLDNFAAANAWIEARNADKAVI